jgi:hypothetical protein
MKYKAVKKEIYCVVIVIGAFLTHYAYSPGLVRNDSSIQFHQSQTFNFSDWHPPIMTFIWFLTNKLVFGPEGFFLLQISLYWGGFFLIGIKVINDMTVDKFSPGKYMLLCALPFSPFLLNLCGTIFKDALVFGCFIMALGLILLRPKGTKIWSWRSPIIFGLLVIGSLARHNSVVGAVPLLVLYLWPEAPGRQRVRSVLGRGVIALILGVVAIIGIGKVMDDFVFHATKEHPESSLFLFDLVGISYRLNQNLVPGTWSDDEVNQILTRCYTPATWDSLASYGYCPFVYNRLAESGAWQGLLPLWARAVAKYPLEYAAHRLDYVHTLLWPQGIFPWDPNRESFEFGFRENCVFKFIRGVLVFVQYHFPLYMILTVGFWMASSIVVAGILFILYLKHPNEYYTALLVALSAAFYVVPLLIIGPAGDYRYVYWSAGATCIAVFLAPSAVAKLKDKPDQTDRAAG